MGKDNVALRVLMGVVLQAKGALLQLLARVMVLVNLETVTLLLRAAEGRSVRRISERDATRSREGCVLEEVVMETDVTEDVRDESRLSVVGRVGGGLRITSSLEDLRPTPSGMNAPGGCAAEVGVVRVMLGVDVDTDLARPTLPEFVVLWRATLRSVWRLFWNQIVTLFVSLGRLSRKAQ